MVVEVVKEYAKEESFAVVGVKYCQREVGHMEFAFGDSFSLFVKEFMFDTVKEACWSKSKISLGHKVQEVEVGTSMIDLAEVGPKDIPFSYSWFILNNQWVLSLDEA